MMRYQEFLPSSKAREFIKCYWLIDSEDQVVALQNRYIPFGCIDLIFQWKPILYYYVESDNQRVHLPRFMIAPLAEKAFDIQLSGAAKMFGVRLHSYAARSVFKRPVTELNNTIWPLENVLGADYCALGEAICSAAGSDEMIQLADDFFSERIDSFLPVDHVIKNICAQLTDLDSDVEIKNVYKRYGNTEQAIRLRFQRTVGITPKLYQKLARIHYALSLRLYRMKQEKNLTSIALQAGYYDQAHFIREFQQVLKSAPGQFMECSFPVTKFYLNPENHSFLLNRH